MTALACSARPCSVIEPRERGQFVTRQLSEKVNQSVEKWSCARRESAVSAEVEDAIDAAAVPWLDEVVSDSVASRCVNATNSL